MSQKYNNSYDYYRKNQLNDIIKKIYIITDWHSFYSTNKKIPKQEQTNFVDGTEKTILKLSTQFQKKQILKVLIIQRCFGYAI